MLELIFLLPILQAQDEEFNEFLRELDRPEQQSEENTTTSTTSDIQYSTAQIDILNRTNSFRNRQGRNSLAPHPSLMSSAQRYANYMAQRQRMVHSSRSWRGNASENIARTGSGNARIMELWITSRKGHRGNMLSSWKYVGVGVARGSNGVLYACQHFSSSPTGAAASDPSSISSTRRTYYPRRRLRLFRRRR